MLNTHPGHTLHALEAAAANRQRAHTQPDPSKHVLNISRTSCTPACMSDPSPTLPHRTFDAPLLAKSSNPRPRIPQVDLRQLRKLILDGKLAPCYPGGEEPTSAVKGSLAAPAEECPICFMFYPVLNTSKCCSKRVCTECFLQVRCMPSTCKPTAACVQQKQLLDTVT